MKYEIMFYSGIVGTVIMLILTIRVFIKYEIIQVVKDLLGVNLKKINKEDKDKNSKEVKNPSSTTRSIKFKKLAADNKIAIDSEENESDETELLEDFNNDETELIYCKSITEEIDNNIYETTLLNEVYEEEKDNFKIVVDIMVVNSEFTV